MRLAGDISLRASFPLVAVLVALHLVAGLLPWLSNLDVVPALTVDACVVVSALQSVLSQRRLRSVVLRLHDAGQAELVTGDEVRPVLIEPLSQVFAGVLIVVHWTDISSGRRRCACLLHLAMPRDAWHLLACWLRWRLDVRRS